MSQSPFKFLDSYTRDDREIFFGRDREYYFRSLEIRRQNNLLSAVPWTMLGIASTFEAMGRYNEALDYYNQGLLNSDKRCALQCETGPGARSSEPGALSAFLLSSLNCPSQNRRKNWKAVTMSGKMILSRLMM